MRRVVEIALLFLAFSSCRRGADAPADVAAPRRTADRIEFAANSPQVRSFRVEPALETGAAAVSLTGRLTWDEDVTARIMPPLAGRITRIAVAPGARVRRGQLLATLSSPDFGQAQADAARAAADLALAERSHERVARLYERGGAARKDLEAVQTELARSRAEADRTRRRLILWGGNPAGGLDQAYAVRSPFDGVIVERNANPAQEARPDATVPLFVVTNPTRLWVLLDVTERDLGAISKGDALLVRSGADPRRSFPARIDWIGASLDPATRTVRVRGSVRDPTVFLKAEMYVAVDDLGARPRRTVMIPAAAVLTEGGGPFCFLEEAPGRFRKVSLDVGPERDGRVPVLRGLPAGARVVTEGSLLLSSFFPGAPRA